MPAGIQIFNQDGHIQIDENYKNLALAHQGSVVTQTWSGSGSQSTYATVTVAGTNPILAFRCAAATAACLYVSQSGGNWTFNLYASSGSPVTIDWWVFDEPTSSGLDYGFQVFDAAGNLTFDAGLKYMRVRDIVSFNYGAPPGETTWDSGRLYAAVQAKFSGIVRDQWDSVNTTRREEMISVGARGITNGLDIDLAAIYLRIQLTGDTHINIFEQYIPGQFLVIDVTDF